MKKLLTFTVIFMTVCLFAALAAGCGENTTTPLSSGGTSTPANHSSATTTPAGSAPATTPAGSSTAGTTAPAPEEYVGVPVENPVYSSANDPWVIEHDGHYYYCFSGGANGRAGVRVGEIESIDKLTSETAKQVYLAPESGMYSKEYWAPELHYLNGEWYIYVAADDGNNANHRMYVLKGTSQDPTDPFKFVGKISDPSDKWAIDGTVLQYRGEMYFIWSGWQGNTDGQQDLYIAHMSDPATIDSERVRIATPDLAFERSGMPIEEGPAAVIHGDDVFVFYSGSGSWTNNYCIGYLRLVGEDPMRADSWEKAAKPLLRQRIRVAYGPGHCSVAPAPDGSLWVILHANLESGTGWQGRSAWITPLTFDENGLPVIAPLARTVTFPHLKTE